MTIADRPVMKSPPSARAPGPFTPEDVIALENEALYELVNGYLVEKPMSLLSNWVGGRVAFYFNGYFEKNPVARVYPETTFKCFPNNPDQIRRPDVAVVLLSALPGFPDGHALVRPDIAIEVVSPSDTVYDLDEKLADYEQAAIPLVWVLNPKSRKVRVHRPDAAVEFLADGDTLTADPVLPGFSVKVSDLFPPPK